MTWKYGTVLRHKNDDGVRVMLIARDSVARAMLMTTVADPKGDFIELVNRFYAFDKVWRLRDVYQAGWVDAEDT